MEFCYNIIKIVTQHPKYIEEGRIMAGESIEVDPSGQEQALAQD